MAPSKIEVASYSAAGASVSLGSVCIIYLYICRSRKKRLAQIQEAPILLTILPIQQPERAFIKNPNRWQFVGGENVERDLNEVGDLEIQLGG
jgi:hypothetical protein